LELILDEHIGGNRRQGPTNKENEIRGGEFGGGWVIIIAEVARASILMMFAGGAGYKTNRLVEDSQLSWSESGEY